MSLAAEVSLGAVPAFRIDAIAVGLAPEPARRANAAA
jgi:hypothetical protein